MEEWISSKTNRADTGWNVVVYLTFSKAATSARARIYTLERHAGQLNEAIGVHFAFSLATKLLVVRVAFIT